MNTRWKAYVLFRRAIARIGWLVPDSGQHDYGCYLGRPWSGNTAAVSRMVLLEDASRQPSYYWPGRRALRASHIRRRQQNASRLN